VTAGASSASPAADQRGPPRRAARRFTSLSRKPARPGPQCVEDVLVQVERGQDQHLRRRAARATSGPAPSGPAPAARPTSAPAVVADELPWSPRSRRCPASGRPSAPRPAPAARAGRRPASAPCRPPCRGTGEVRLGLSSSAAKPGPAPTLMVVRDTTTEITALLSPGSLTGPASTAGRAAGAPGQARPAAGPRRGTRRPVAAPGLYSAPPTEKRPPPASRAGHDRPAAGPPPPLARCRRPRAATVARGRPRPVLSRGQWAVWPAPRAPARCRGTPQPQRAGAVAQLHVRPRRPGGGAASALVQRPPARCGKPASSTPGSSGDHPAPEMISRVPATEGVARGVDQPG